MQKDQPKPISPEFGKSAAVPPEQAIELEIHKIGTKRDKDGYKQLVDRQKKALQSMKDGFDERREGTVKAMAQRIRDEEIRKQAPGLVLRPRDFPPNDRKNMIVSAEKTAKAQLAEIEKQRIQETRDGFLRDQKRYLKKVRSSHERTQKSKDRKKSDHTLTKEFNRAANSYDNPPGGAVRSQDDPSPDPPSHTRAAKKLPEKERPQITRPKVQQIQREGGRGR